MAKQKKPDGVDTGRPCTDCPKKQSGKKKTAEFVENVLEKIEKKLGENDIKPSVGDYLRLLQYRDEIETDEPKEIKVTWVEPATTESEREA